MARTRDLPSEHDELISHRQEERAELLVHRERPRLHAIYEEWGYRHAGEKLSFPDSLLYDVMVLDLTQQVGVRWWLCKGWQEIRRRPLNLPPSTVTLPTT